MGRNYSVWVEGSEVNDKYLPLDEALQLASRWTDNGHGDVFITGHDTEGAE